LFSAVPVVWSFAFHFITPDLLLACMVLFYLVMISDRNYPQRLSKGILCGILGGLGYLTKSFVFPFFICHFFLMNVFYYFRIESKEDKHKVVHNFLAGAVAFALISGIWIGLISSKYGKLTYGTAGRANLAWQAAPDAKGTPVHWQGFVEPPNETAICAAEDPSYLGTPPYNPFGSWANFRHQMKLFAGNMKEIGNIFMRFSFLSLPIVVAYVLFWLRKFSLKTISVELFCPILTIILMVGAFSNLLVRERYLWVVNLLLILMGGYVLARVFENSFFAKMRVAILIVFFLSFVVPASLALKERANTGKEIYSLSRILKDDIKPGGNIASKSGWPVVLYLCYHLDCKFYGLAKKDVTEAELKEDLKEYKIDYYFVWGGAAGDHNFLTDYVELTGGRFSIFRVFGLKKPRLH
jgi:4-amino-4-deoxy-L-arabinose transferase-like glycosyltransferase